MNNFARDLNSIDLEPIQAVNNNKLGGNNTLRRRLLLTILPTVIVPLVVVSAIGYSIVQRRVTDRELQNLQENSHLTSRVSSVFLAQSFKIPHLVASNPTLTAALRSQSKKLI